MTIRPLVAGCVLCLTVAGSAHAQCPDGTPPPCAGARSRAVPPTSIAVLAFENLSRDTADSYLIDGLAEELTGRLGALQRLRVTGRSVTRRAQQAAGGDAQAVGRTLNVRYLVEGSLRRSGPRVRISARLLRVSDGVLVWSDDYNRTMADLLALQEELASQVASSVTGQLLPGERTALAARPTTNAAAYDHYLRGRYLLVRRTVASISQGAAEFDEAVRLDPRFAAAEAARASVLVLAFGYGVPLAPDESLAVRARRHAVRALQLDSSSSDAWSAIGQVHFWFDPTDIDASRAALTRAAALDPRNADAHHLLGVVLQSVPEATDAAAAAFQRALAIEPARGVSLLDLAEVRAVQGRTDEARVLADSALALEPLQARIHLFRSALRRKAGDIAGARSDAEHAFSLSAPARVRLFVLTTMIEFDVLAGDSATARARLLDIERSGISWPIMHALALAHLGMPDSALAVLTRGPMIPVDWGALDLPSFDALRRLPGYERALAPWRPRRSRI